MAARARAQRARLGRSWRRGDLAAAEQLFRESIRILKPLEDRGTLCESQRSLAQVLVEQGKLEEAERYALEARKTVGPHDMHSRATTRMALGLVRAAQGRDEEAEALLREALDILDGTDLPALSAFEPARGARRLPPRPRPRRRGGSPTSERLAELPARAAARARRIA